MSPKRSTIFLKPHHQEIHLWLGLLLLLFISLINGMRLSLGWTQSLTPRLIVFVVFGLALALVGVGLIYLLRLRWSRGRVFELNEMGILDKASPLSLGPVPMSSVEAILFERRAGMEFLVVKLKRSERFVSPARGPIAFVYGLLFGQTVRVPLVLFDLTRHDAEAQVLHLKSVMRGERPVEDLVSVRSQQGRSRPHPPELPQPSIPPPLNPERHKVIEQVGRIRSEVKRLGIDRLAADLYFDHIAFLPELLQSRQQAPEGVDGLYSCRKSSDYEEVSFGFKGSKFLWGLRRDVGASDEALLSLGVNGQVVMLLRVRVEIGQLAPIETEGFIDGNWREQLVALQAAIDDWVKSRLGPGMDLTDPGLDGRSIKIDDLKNRFGLRD